MKSISTWSYLLQPGFSANHTARSCLEAKSSESRDMPRYPAIQFRSFSSPNRQLKAALQSCIGINAYLFPALMIQKPRDRSDILFGNSSGERNVINRQRSS